ncbi:MAG: hypothetical protein H0U43_08770 [Chthoniobacterales bacterium]|nr:hypothetical protein [Chthoniobacterales bacterium]
MRAPLSAAEIAAIRDYTDRGYERINQQLRECDVAPQMLRKVQTLAAALNHLPAFRGDVYRGTRIDDLDLLEKYRGVGTVIVEDAFVSCSRSPLKMYGGNVLFYILSKRGRDIARWSAHPEEEEVLFRPGTSFKILAFQQTGHDVEIFLEEV